MRSEIYWKAFGTLLLISLCYSARLSDSLVNGGELTSEVDRNDTTNGSSKVTENEDEVDAGFLFAMRRRAGRCYGTVKRWLGYVDDQELEGDPNQVRFFLYPSPAEKQYAEEIVFGRSESLRQSQFGNGLPLKIIIHGFTKSYDSEAVQMIKNAYLAYMFEDPSRESMNIVLVDWEPLANPQKSLELISYRSAVANVGLVGQRVGEFIHFLIQNGAVRSLKDVHIIGFSLGAHVAGAAGNTLRELNAGQLASRVTGLDPAGPAFYQGARLTSSFRSLRKMDGRFVDVIHTSMGLFGTLDALGHADFYPNGGGPIQQRCVQEYDQNHVREAGTSSLSNTVTRAEDISSCSHGKAPEFFAMSILHPTMIGCRCESYVSFRMGCGCTEKAILGEFCDPRTRGKFYLNV